MREAVLQITEWDERLFTVVYCVKHRNQGIHLFKINRTIALNPDGDPCECWDKTIPVANRASHGTISGIDV